MKNNDTLLGENAVDRTTSENDVVDGIQKDRYEELYDYYLQLGFDALKRDFNLEISREAFIRNCIKYVDKCPYYGWRKENLQICRNMYKEYVKNGFKGVVKKFNYQHSREVLINWFKNLLDEYDSKARMRHVEKENVEKYTKIYEEYKKSGLLNLKDKFGCSNNRNFLLRQFKKYVNGFNYSDFNTST